MARGERKRCAGRAAHSAGRRKGTTLGGEAQAVGEQPLRRVVRWLRDDAGGGGSYSLYAPGQPLPAAAALPRRAAAWDARGNAFGIRGFH